MRTSGPRGIKLHILLIILLTLVAVAPAANAQLGTSVRIGTGDDTDVTLDTNADGTDIVLDTRNLSDTDATGTIPSRVLGDAKERTATPVSLRLHTRIDDRTIDRLVSSALEVPEVRDMLKPGARLDVAVDGTHFRVDVASGAVQSVTAQSSVANADYVIRASTDAARSLANAADPGFTAIQLLKGHYMTIEAERFTHQAALKALFSGFLDGKLSVQDRLTDVTFEGDITAAEAALLASGLRIVRVNGHLYAANHFGGLVAALHDGNRALGDPPEALGVRLSGIPGGSTMDRMQLGVLVAANPDAEALRAALRQAPGTETATPGLDPERGARLLEQGAPNPFLVGLGAHTVANVQLRGDTA